MHGKISHCVVALKFGFLLSFLHFVWLALVGLGWAKAYMDYVFGLHFIQMEYSMLDFEWGKAVLLLVLTFVVGYALGWVVMALFHPCKK